jgi:hypothetical protein
LLSAAVCVACLGCGGGSGLEIAPVKGKVTHNGQAVTGGSLVFTPTKTAGTSAKPGKPAEGLVDANGEFSLSTHGNKDGAVVGTHRVSYSPPAPQIPEGGLKPGQMPKPSPYDHLVPELGQVEVKSGSNEIEIKLVRRTK